MSLPNRRSIELKPVPEGDGGSNANDGSALSMPSTHKNGLVHHGTRSGRGGASASAAPLGRIAGTSSVRREAAATAPQPGLATMSRFGIRGQNAALGRTSLVMRLQQGGRQLMDLGRLQADWLSNTAVKGPEAQDYVNEADQGFVALLARHVEVPLAAWHKLAQYTPGVQVGHYFQSPHTPGDFTRTSNLPQTREGPGGGAETTAEEGRAREASGHKPRRSIFGLPVIQPYNLFAVLWTMGILFLDLTYTAFWVPMNVAFCTAEYGKLSSGCTTSDIVGGALYLINVLLGFQIGVVATNGIRKRTVVDGRLVSWLYIWHGRFVLDVVASVPMLYLIVVLAGQSHFRLNKGWVNCLSLLRLLRMVRLVSITKVVYRDSLSGRFQDSWLARVLSVTVLYSIFLAYHLAVAINLFACIMVLCAYFEGYENSWMTAVDWANVPDASPLYQWYCAIYWMIVTATTTGFGDFQPRSIAEQVVANVAMVGGMIMFGVLVASIGQALSRATREAHQAYSGRQKVVHVMEWAKIRNLPEHLQQRVQNFFADKYGGKEEEARDQVMLDALPSRLRAKVALSICGPILRDVHILGELPKDLRDLIAEHMRPLRLPAGEDLCQQGDVTSCLWILNEGTIEAVRYKEAPVLLSSKGQHRLLGESILIGEAVETSRIRPWTLRTKSFCRLWGITLGELYPLMRMYPCIGQMAAEYVKRKTLTTFLETMVEGGGGGEWAEAIHPGVMSHDEHWCEVADVIKRYLLDYTPHDNVRKLVEELAKASALDGSLQTLLDQLLVLSATRRVTVHGPPGSTSLSRRDTNPRFLSAASALLPLPSSPPLPSLSPPLPSLSPPPPLSPLESEAEPHGGGLDVGPPVAAAGGSSGSAADNPLFQQPQEPPPLQQQRPYLGTTGFGGTAFGTAAAAAALTAALHGPSSPKSNQQQQGLGPGPSLGSELQPVLASVGGGGGEDAGVKGLGYASALAARIAGQAANTSPLSAVVPATGGGGGGGNSSAVVCLGCQRCICPSCGQGMDTVPPKAAPAAPAPQPSAVAAGAAARPGALAPGMRAWVNRQATLQRVSIGLRADQAWATERRSLDRRLATTSVMSVYE